MNATGSRAVEQIFGYAADELDERGATLTSREIARQPALWRRVATSVEALAGRRAEFLAPLLRRPGLRVVLTGAGTSAFAGEVLAPTLRRQLRRRVDAVATTDLVADPYGCLGDDVATLLVSFARSGDSPESIAATQLGDQVLGECHHLIITCNPDGQLHREHRDAASSMVLLMPEGADDEAFAMTSSFSGMVLAALLVLTSTPAAVQMTERLASAAEQALPEIAARTRAWTDEQHERVVYLGSGSLRGLARESALKLVELTAGRLLTVFDSPLGFRHGPKAVLDEHTLAVVYVSNDPYTRRYDLDLVAELRRSLPLGHVVALAGSRSVGDDDLWQLPGLEDADDIGLTLCFVLVAQVFGLHASLQLGCTPDNPFPSQEVNRVVQGVTIHPLPD